ncbi:MAG: hypothetical protein GY826_15450 [Fuerstiella sp.]|nr:hypothetical protein [Fuerstiella sp.]
MDEEQHLFPATLHSLAPEPEDQNNSAQTKLPATIAAAELSLWYTETDVPGGSPSSAVTLVKVPDEFAAIELAAVPTSLVAEKA